MSMLGSQGYKEIVREGRSSGRHAAGSRPRCRRSAHQRSGAVRGVVLVDRLSAEEARSAVLERVLLLHPTTHLTIPTLVSSLLDSPERGGAELECAVRDSVGEGLLGLKRGLLWPTSLALEAGDSWLDVGWPRKSGNCSMFGATGARRAPKRIDGKSFTLYRCLSTLVCNRLSIQADLGRGPLC